MKRNNLMVLLLTTTLVQAVSQESIRSGERSGIPDRADAEKTVKEESQDKVKEQKSREVKENQEDTDPVFYDSTTSPQEMNGNGTL